MTGVDKGKWKPFRKRYSSSCAAAGGRIETTGWEFCGDRHVGDLE